MQNDEGEALEYAKEATAVTAGGSNHEKVVWQ